MKQYEIAIIGSGMGGSMIASLNKHKEIVVFEKDKNLGGCASTFKRFGKYFNSGATTFVGYEDNHPIKNIFDSCKNSIDIVKSDIAIRVIQNGKKLDRVKDFEEFLENLNRVYPNKNNRVFWSKIKEIDEKFWKIKEIFFSKYSLKAYIKSAGTVLNLFSIFGFDVLKSADSFIKESLGEISIEYRNFIDAQLLITLQTTSKDISLLSLSLGLAYPFHDVFYVNGGMGRLFENLLDEIEVKQKEEVLKIEKELNGFKIATSKGEYRAKNVILNSSIYNTSKLFFDEKIKDYYDNFQFSDQSAFVVYISLLKKHQLLHHYQIIVNEIIPNSISNSFFISISDKDDMKMSKDYYSITISTHTKALFWKNLSKDEYIKQKQITENYIVQKFLENFDKIKKDEMIDIFSATSTTFNKYINRYNCGGRAITMKNIFHTPSSKTPFKGIYNIGDTVFAGQGWPGTAIGVMALNKELNG